MSLYVVHFPRIDRSTINAFRRKYDRQYDIIEAHITLVFPLPDAIGRDGLIRHIERILPAFRPFPIRLHGLLRAEDSYLFLMVERGKEGVIELHDRLYGGILTEYLREDIPYKPHLTIGYWGSEDKPINKSEFNEAFREAEEIGFDYECSVDGVTLVQDDEAGRELFRKEFRLAD